MCRPFQDWYTPAPALPEPWPSEDKPVVRAWVEAVIEHPFVQSAIAGAARSLCLRFGAEDREDMKQELTLALVRALPRFNPARGAHIFWFVQVVVMNAARKVWRTRSAKKRQARVDVMQRDLIFDLRRPQREDVNLRLDLQRTIQQFSERGQQLVLLLGDGVTLAEAADRLKMRRGELDRERKKVQSLFEAGGLTG